MRLYFACSAATGGRIVHYDRAEPPSVEGLWDAPVFSLLDDASPEPDEYLEAVRKVCLNGGAVFARLKIAPDIRLDWFITRDRLDEIDFLNRLVASDAMRAVLTKGWVHYELSSDVLSGPGAETWPPRFGWNPCASVDLHNKGLLAGVLEYCGAYDSYGRGAATKLGAAAAALLLDGRPDDHKVFTARCCWCLWFHGALWDPTFIGIDVGRRQAWILCATDTD